mmetsp:Transcript_7693/g.25468  ORF Transcript_7693/g.25468 Transcript_7693/m.25468 type:complete len:152 (+) Transcript_7693:1395-1850(+)
MVSLVVIVSSSSPFSFFLRCGIIVVCARALESQRLDMVVDIHRLSRRFFLIVFETGAIALDGNQGLSSPFASEVNVEPREEHRAKRGEYDGKNESEHRALTAESLQATAFDDGAIRKPEVAESTPSAVDTRRGGVILVGEDCPVLVGPSAI